MVEALLETYDKERRVLPMPVTQWKWGWTQSAETWNGRCALWRCKILGHFTISWQHSRFAFDLVGINLTECACTHVQDCNARYRGGYHSRDDDRSGSTVWAT